MEINSQYRKYNQEREMYADDAMDIKEEHEVYK